MIVVSSDEINVFEYTTMKYLIVNILQNFLNISSASSYMDLSNLTNFLFSCYDLPMPCGCPNV